MESNLSYFKLGLFVLYEILMSIAVLNLLIAVMTESYTQLMQNERLMFTYSRAVIIDEMEICLPRFHIRSKIEISPYVHFVIVKKET